MQGGAVGRGRGRKSPQLVMAGLVPATPIIWHGRAAAIGVAGPSPAMTPVREAMWTGYSAACRASMRSTRAAQYLNSGILPNGSSAGLVSRFAAAST